MKKLLIVLLLVPGFGHAQSQSAEEFMRMSEMILPNADVDYPPIRCAAFYRSIHLLFDDTQLGPDGDWNMQQLEQAFRATAAIVRQEDRGVSETEALESVVEDIEIMSGLYLERYRILAQQGGNPFVSDPMLTEDNAFCTNLFQRIVAAYE